MESSAKITRKELFLIIKSESLFKTSISKCNERLFDYVINKFNIRDCSSTTEQELKTRIKVFITKLRSKWQKCHNMQDRFFNKQAKWLGEEFQVPQFSKIKLVTPGKKLVQGRPKKSFEESSLRSKQRNVQTLVKNITPEQLSYAAESSLVKSGRRKTAKVIKLALEASPKSLNKMESVKKTPLQQKYSSEEALALIIDTDLTKEHYIKIQRGAKTRGANIYPAYNAISEVKKTCYPNNIKISESEVSIPVQDLLDFTICRLFEVQKEVFLLHLPTEIVQIDVYYKWGLDGSGGHSIYKQKFLNNPKYSDSNIVLSTIVLLEMSAMHKDKKIIFWKNLSPSSTKYCRPICFKLVKESNQTTREIYNTITQQIENLNSTNILLNDERHIQFKHIPICTMMDGKTCNVLTDTVSTQACNICKVTPKYINDLENVTARPCNISAFRFGISVLHSYLRCYEYLLHIAYKMELQLWQSRGDAAKDAVKDRKNSITNLFYEKMGLVVDQPKQGGGNSNDGNTARKFFDNPTIVAEITGLDENLLKRFANILSTISSCHYIKLDTYKAYCLETAKLCVQNYGWYKMSASVHKLLIHSSDIIASLPLPVGQLSEDVLEASQKDYKNMRLFHSRKTSRVDTNTDIIHWMLINSDPLITSKRQKPTKSRKVFNEDVLSMITVPEFLKNICTESDSDDESDNADLTDSD